MTERHTIRFPPEYNELTSVTLEPLIWHWLREIAEERELSIGRLVHEIDRDYRLITDRNG